MDPRYLLPALLALGACAPARPAPGTAVPPPPAEAPDTLARTESRPIADVPRRTIGFLDPDVWISNEIEGGRLSDVRRADDSDSLFVARVEPENAPINPSPWYAFKIWSGEPRTILLRLTYEDGEHRYRPVTRRSGGAWTPLDSTAVAVDTVAGEATLRLRVGPDTLWVAGQETLTSSFFRRWTDSLAALPHVARSVIGESARGRPLHMLELGNPAAPRHVMLIGRQHPPEVTGTIALVRFVEELAGDSPLAREFRDAFRIHVVPLMNPDGVDLGHWRHNTGGVDLNRDWEAFAQPETRHVRDAFVRIMEQPGARMWFAADFHSTFRDVFYTLDRAYETHPAGVTDEWIAYLESHLPDYTVNDDPSGPGSPISRNWFYEHFGAPALTYEVGDHTDRDVIRQVATTAAHATMRVLLDALAEQP